MGIRSNLPDFILNANYRWFLASKGGFKAVISYNKQPDDHISDFSLYLDSFIYSGLI